jgi:parvulin-like peptidyl-prolyl isomerase
MKRILLILLINFFIFSQYTHSKQKILTVAVVNNTLITNIDIENEIFLLKKLNPKIKDVSLTNISLQNLIEQIIKIEEIKKNNIQVSEEYVKKKYNNFLTTLKKNNLTKNNKKNIYLKIKTEDSWNRLISKKFLWGTYINLSEIEKNVEKKNPLSKKSDDEFNTKEKMIKNEKNKRLNVMSMTYLNKLKREAFIKIY